MSVQQEQPLRLVTEEELRALSGYKKRSKIREWVSEAGFKLLPEGRDGRLSAMITADPAANDSQEIEFA